MSLPDDRHVHLEKNNCKLRHMPQLPADETSVVKLDQPLFSERRDISKTPTSKITRKIGPSSSPAPEMLDANQNGSARDLNSASVPFETNQCANRLFDDVVPAMSNNLTCTHLADVSSHTSANHSSSTHSNLLSPTAIENEELAKSLSDLAQGVTLLTCRILDAEQARCSDHCRPSPVDRDSRKVLAPNLVSNGSNIKATSPSASMTTLTYSPTAHRPVSRTKERLATGFQREKLRCRLPAPPKVFQSRVIPRSTVRLPAYMNDEMLHHRVPRSVNGKFNRYPISWQERRFSKARFVTKPFLKTSEKPFDYYRPRRKSVGESHRKAADSCDYRSGSESQSNVDVEFGRYDEVGERDASLEFHDHNHRTRSRYNECTRDVAFDRRPAVTDFKQSRPHWKNEWQRSTKRTAADGPTWSNRYRLPPAKFVAVDKPRSEETRRPRHSEKLGHSVQLPGDSNDLGTDRPSNSFRENRRHLHTSLSANLSSKENGKRIDEVEDLSSALNRVIEELIDNDVPRNSSRAAINNNSSRSVKRIASSSTSASVKKQTSGGGDHSSEIGLSTSSRLTDDKHRRSIKKSDVETHKNPKNSSHSINDRSCNTVTHSRSKSEECKVDDTQPSRQTSSKLENSSNRTRHRSRSSSIGHRSNPKHYDELSDLDDELSDLEAFTSTDSDEREFSEVYSKRRKTSRSSDRGVREDSRKHSVSSCDSLTMNQFRNDKYAPRIKLRHDRHIRSYNSKRSVEIYSSSNYVSQKSVKRRLKSDVVQSTSYGSDWSDFDDHFADRGKDRNKRLYF